MAFALTILLLEPKPNISLRPSAGVAPGGAVTIRCECRCRGVRVLLSKAGDLNARRSMDPVRDVAEFPIRIVSQGDAGNYSCQYSTKRDPLPVWSEPSDPVELVVAGGTDPTHPGTVPAPTRPGSPGPGGSELKLSIPIIAGVSAAAAGLLLLLLLLAFICYRRSGGGKGPAPRQSRESEAATTVYALVGEGNQLDVLTQDPGAEGLTYAELDGQALQAKRRGPAPAPEPALYATINMSRGPMGRSPGMQGRPPPTPIA
ncbi:leukocyte immunoglobulin-like receptor subfamily B member 3 [Trachemys scripta elegans]|uniref:leukocyte immunoglobulin-like receptor subfamily B member 3 n=1 Tax=Trachemys scripta elegans TaxID=31138 RepID=UPI0015536342|nr:leukocyte immunoglobulin-like receptor subfamily B member 3 [Trachemys scripta elegans]